jgi:rod shape-determining protein MreD
VLFQVLLFNQIHLWGFGCVFLYCYFVIAFPFNTSQYSVLLIGFLLGFIIDVFSQSFGIHAFATTLIAYLRPNILKLYIGALDFSMAKRTSNTLNLPYAYIVTLIFIHHLTLFSLEAFSFKLFFPVIYKTLISTVLTTIFVFFTKSLFAKKK